MNDGNVDFEEQVINNLTEDAKCIYKNLNEKGNDFVKNMLNKFDGESKLSLELTSKDKVYYTDKNGVTREVAGKTRSPVNNSILISINSSMANETSSLGLARDLLHEIIHADMFRKLENTNSTGTIEDVDFNDTYNKYKAEHFIASPDHETMADLYIDAMSTTLKEFHKTVLINDYNKYVQHYGEEPPKEFYETFAWDGLRNQGVRAWDELDEEERSIIEDLQLRVGDLTKDCPNE